MGAIKSEIKYIELKSGYHDDGPAWIGRVEFSKSGQTTYFNGHAFKGKGHGGCLDLETGKLYWITGVKKNGENRRYSNAKIMVERGVVDEFLLLIGATSLDLRNYEIVDVTKTDKQKFAALENAGLEDKLAHNHGDSGLNIKYPTTDY